jgi:hypothetical protein
MSIASLINPKKIIMDTLELAPDYFQHSHHSRLRASQRGISFNTIALLLKYGSVIKKQGLLFYYITKSEIKYIAPKYKARLKNLVAVVAHDKTIITCYKNQKAIKSIRKKSNYVH